MKITQKQLKRIIKEEKAKLLAEQMNPQANAERALGSFADMAAVDRVTDGVLDLLQSIEMGAVEEGLEDEEAEEMASNGAILAVAQAFQSAGLMEWMLL